jgi:hypothetical protein
MTAYKSAITVPGTGTDQRAGPGRCYRPAHRHYTNPNAFIWTKIARDILQKVFRTHPRLSSKRNVTLDVWYPPIRVVASNLPDGCRKINPVGGTQGINSTGEKTQY